MATATKTAPARKGPKPQLFERIEKLKTVRGHKAADVDFERKLVNPKEDVSDVIVTLTYSDGDRIGAQGATTERAIDALEDKIASWPKKATS